MEEHQERIRAFEKRKANRVSILTRGTVSPEDSVHHEALLDAPDRPSLPGLQLKPHQEENAICMRACEARGKLPLREGSQTHVLSDMAVLCDPPGSGMMVSMIAHLAEAPLPRPETSEFITALRERTSEQKWRNSVVIDQHMIRVDPSPPQVDATVFQPTTLIVAHHGVVDAWAGQLQKLAPRLKTKVVAKTSDVNGILVDSPDVIVLSQTFHATVSKQFANLRLARVVFDDCSQLSVSTDERYFLKACFTWLIEPQPEVYLQLRDTVGPDQRRPRAFRNTFARAFAWVDDLTPLFVRHSSAEVARSLGSEYPHHTVYHCRGDAHIGTWLYNGKELWKQYRTHRLEKPVPGTEAFIPLLELGAEVVSKETAVFLCNSQDARDRVRFWKDEACMVCWGGFREKPSVCVMQCCKQLMCAACSLEVVASIGTCPICRENIRAADGIKQVFDEVDPQNPINVAFAPQGFLDNRPITWFKRILTRLRQSAKVIVYVDSPLSFRYRFDMDIEYIMAHEGEVLHIKQLTGNRYHVKNAVEYFNSDDRDPHVRKGLVLSRKNMGHGCSLHKATDLIILSQTSTAVYRHLLSRAVNPKSARVNEGMPLRVHVLHSPGNFIPDLQLALPDSPGAGVEWRKSIYNRAMAEQNMAVDSYV